MYPYVTVIMPIRNEEEYIARSLGAVLAQDYPADRMEVLVVDGMSTDGTHEIIRGLAAQHPQITVRFLDNQGGIAPAGLNLATREARGAIIIRVDGHCVIAPDYVRKCVEHIQKDGVDGVGGPMQAIGDGYISELTAVAMSSKFGVGDSSFRTEQGRTKLTDTVPFPAYTRQIVELAGPYDEELVRNQDDEYNYRIRKLGGKILLARDVTSKYYTRSSLLKLAKQYYQYGFYKVRVLQKHPVQMSYRQFVPPAFVLALILSIGFALMGWGWWLLALISGTYLVANLSASLFTAGWQGLRYLPLLPLAFAILHFGYGAGFLLGLIRFIRNWNDPVGELSTLSGEIQERSLPPAD
jgi:glycosyltransferase involved in cell wall biosynthesis